jgi:hypothetical protein
MPSRPPRTRNLLALSPAALPTAGVRRGLILSRTSGSTMSPPPATRITVMALPMRLQMAAAAGQSLSRVGAQHAAVMGSAIVGTTPPSTTPPNVFPCHQTFGVSLLMTAPATTISFILGRRPLWVRQTAKPMPTQDLEQRVMSGRAPNASMTVQAESAQEMTRRWSHRSGDAECFLSAQSRLG